MSKIRFFIMLSLTIVINIYGEDKNFYKESVKKLYQALFSNRNYTINEFSDIYANASPDLKYHF